MSAGVYKTGIPNVAITLVPSNSSMPQETTLTQANGYYQFTSLPAGTYTLVETQPIQYLSGGKDTAGSLGGQGSTSDSISQIKLAAGQKGTEYDFGEYLLTQAYLSKRLALASTPTTAAPQLLTSPPVVALGGTTTNYTTSSIGGSAVNIAPSATITEGTGSGDLASMTLTITDLKDGSLEALVIPGQKLGTPSQPLSLAAPLSSKITAAYSSATGTLTLSGVDSASDYQSVLRSIQHVDNAASPDPSARAITVVAYDAISSSSPATSTVNDPPGPAKSSNVKSQTTNAAFGVQPSSLTAATVVPTKQLTASLVDKVLASVKNWWDV